MPLELKARMSRWDLMEFASSLKQLSREIGFKVSARGWAYLLETRRLINKDEFDTFLDETNLDDSIDSALEIIRNR